MNSREALDILDRIHPDDLDAVADEESVRAALEVVAADEGTARLRAAHIGFDKRVSQLITRTPAPTDDLRVRLFDSLGLADASSSAVTIDEPIRVVHRRGFLRAFAAAAGVAGAAGLGLWLRNRPKPTPVTIDGLRERGVAVFDDVTSLPLMDDEAGPVTLLPHGWLGGAIAVASEPRGLAIGEGEPASAAVYEFAVMDRGRRVRGVLIAVPTSELANPPALQFFDPGGADYTGPFDSVAWFEGRTTYVCLVRDGDLGAIESALSFAVPV